jgi:regulation of enolase protein 1 (concanavalin A-like superfamily)
MNTLIINDLYTVKNTVWKDPYYKFMDTLKHFLHKKIKVKTQTGLLIKIIRQVWMRTGSIVCIQIYENNKK